MPSLNIDLDYFQHPKVVRLIGRLGKIAEVLPIKLWIYCGKFHAEDGRLEGYLPKEIEAQIDWRGEPGKCVEAMVDIGLLDLLPDYAGYQVHDWWEHASHIAVYKLRARIGAAKKHGHDKEVEVLQALLQALLNRPPSTARAVQSSAVQLTTKPPPPSAPTWCVELATEIARHVQTAFGKNTPSTQVQTWATAIDRLTRSKALAPPPEQAEIEAVIRWGIQDRGRGDGKWPGWSKQIRSAPDADKFVKIRASMAEAGRQGDSHGRQFASRAAQGDKFGNLGS